jgi:hypothetical protein
MTYQRKRPERRTFLQDRFEILIKRQRKGEATFSELTELDDIVNRDPDLREKVIRESILMEGLDDYDEPLNGAMREENPAPMPLKSESLLARLNSLVRRIFTARILAARAGKLAIYA